MGDLLREPGLARFDAVVAAHAGGDDGPGLVALVARGEEVHACVRGDLTIGGPAVQPNSLFRIASTTKPVTGMATMALVDDGLLALDDPVATLLPELESPRVLRRVDGPLDETVPAERPITLRDLLTFTFGFGLMVEMFTAPEPWPVVEAASRLHLSTLGPPDPEDQPDPDTWMAALGSLPLLAQPGERWLYNTGASVLGVLLSRATGLPLEGVYRTRIFEPLGVHDTAFWTADSGRLATAYVATPDGLQVWDPPDGKWNKPPAFGDAAAGLLSTAEDLLALARVLLRGGDPVLSDGAVREMTRDQLTRDQRATAEPVILGGRSWGLCQGVFVDGPQAGAFGWDGGLGTSWLVDPVRDLTVIVLTQRLFQDPQLPPVHLDLQAAAYAAIV